MEVTFASHPILWSLSVGLMLLVLGAWCAAGLMAVKHAPLREDLDGSLPLPEASPQEAERPYIPPAIVVHLSMSDRIGDRATPEELEDFRNACLKVERARVAKWN